MVYMVPVSLFLFGYGILLPSIRIVLTTALIKRYTHTYTKSTQIKSASSHEDKLSAEISHNQNERKHAIVILSLSLVAVVVLYSLLH